MTADTATSQTVTARVGVPPDRLFAVLVDPARHAEIDGSGMVLGAATTEPLGQVGDVFTMDMEQPAFGRYQADSQVVAFEPDRRIAWAPGGAGQPPLGHVWTWELAPEDGATRVTHTYDWSGITDPGLLELLAFPRVSADQMRTSIDRLATAAS